MYSKNVRLKFIQITFVLSLLWVSPTTLASPFELIDKRICVGCQEVHEYEFSNRSSGERVVLRSNTEPAFMENFEFDQLNLFVGEIGSGVDVVFVHSDELKTSEELLMYDLSVSPDRRYLTYREFYPRNAVAPRTKIFVLDLLRGVTVVDGAIALTPNQVYPSAQPTQDFSIEKLVWSSNLEYVIFPIVDSDGYVTMLRYNLRTSSERSKLCGVPLVDASIEGEYRDIAVPNVVEDVQRREGSSDSYSVKLFNNAGVSAIYEVNFSKSCAETSLF